MSMWVWYRKMFSYLHLEFISHADLILMHDMHECITLDLCVVTRSINTPNMPQICFDRAIPFPCQLSNCPDHSGHLYATCALPKICVFKLCPNNQEPKAHVSKCNMSWSTLMERTIPAVPVEESEYNPRSIMWEIIKYGTQLLMLLFVYFHRPLLAK